MALLKSVYQVAASLPDFEKYDLSSQLRRACKSIPSNIAEGYGKRRSPKDFRNYLANALGSTNEMIVHLQIAEELAYLSAEETASLIADYRIVQKQLTRLIEKWQ